MELPQPWEREPDRIVDVVDVYGQMYTMALESARLRRTFFHDDTIDRLCATGGERDPAVQRMNPLLAEFGYAEGS